MSDRRAWASILFLCLLPVLVAAQGERQPAAPNPPPIRPSVTLEGREIGVPVQINPGGPVFGLGPLVEALGGDMVSDPSGESVTLKLAETDVVIGPGNAIITVGDLIVSLSQPPIQGEGGLQVPLDFLRKTYGDLMSFSFEWRPETQRLTIGRRGARDLSVSLDVVHIQGTTTVVLQFPEEPRYRASHEGDVILVQILADRLTPPPPKEVTDPLVASVAVEPQQIRIQLVPGAQAERYILEKPFRLVFDIQRSAEVQVPTAPAAPTDRRAGIRTIVIDPGHGGRETGAIGPSGVMEKELTLQLARELASSVGQALGVRVVLTRQDDSTLALDTRTAIANQNKADLFVSIHLNSSLGAGAHGAETYFLNPQASDSRAASAAASENLGAEETAPGGEASQDLQLILWDLAQTYHLGESQRFANMIQGELNEALQLKDRGVKQAPFRVLMGAAMPAVLVELGFLSNPDEEKQLQDSTYRGQLVTALTRAVARYKALVENQPEPGVQPPTQGQAPQGTSPAQTPAPAPGAGRKPS